MTSDISKKRVRDSITYDHIVLPRDISYNFEQIQESIKNILDIVGCPNCHSGKDILFKDVYSITRDIRRVFMNDFVITKNLEPKSLGESFNIST